MSYAAGFPSCLIQKLCPEKQHLATVALATSAHTRVNQSLLKRCPNRVAYYVAPLRRSVPATRGATAPEANDLNAVRWVAHQRCWMCSLLFLLGIHRPDCEHCHVRETCGYETRKRLEELNWRDV